jgi:hypothetical protein
MRNESNYAQRLIYAAVYIIAIRGEHPLCKVGILIKFLGVPAARSRSLFAKIRQRDLHNNNNFDPDDLAVRACAQRRAQTRFDAFQFADVNEIRDPFAYVAIPREIRYVNQLIRGN